MIAAYPGTAPASPSVEVRAARPARAGSLAASGIPWLQGATLILLTLLCYAPAFRGTFLWDDERLIGAGSLVRASPSLWPIWFSTLPYDYFPLTYSSWWVEWRLWGANPLGYHLVNIGLHLASAFLLWKVLAALRVPGAWLGALLFALHPVNVASVAWIAERKNTLSMFFYLAAALSYLKSEAAGDSRAGRRWYAAAVAIFVCALLSKTSVVMLPCALLLVAWWKRGTITWREVARTAPLFLLSLVFGLLTMWFQYHRSMTPHQGAVGDAMVGRLLRPGWSILFYLVKGVAPVNLSMLYPRWDIDAAAPASYLPDIAVAALLVAAWVGRARWGRAPFFALAYFIVAMLPVVGLVPMTFFNFSYVSDHLVYLSMIAVPASAAALLTLWRERGGIGARAALAVMATVVGLCAAATYARAMEFSSPQNLWVATLKVNPDCPTARNLLGLSLRAQGRMDLAKANFRAALALQPGMPAALVNLANTLLYEGRWAEAAAAYAETVKVLPDPLVFNDYGAALLEMDETERGREQIRQALAREPGLVVAHFNLYRAALHEGDRAVAAAELRACLRLDPNDADALCALAALSLDTLPRDPAPGQEPVLAAESAIALAERACQINGYADFQMLETLSRAYQAAGRRSAAITYATKAHAIHEATPASATR